MGMLMAVEMWMKRDHKAEMAEWLGWLNNIAARVNKVEGVTTTVREARGLSNHSPGLAIRWDPAKLGISGQDVFKILLDTEPRINLARSNANSVAVVPYLLRYGSPIRYSYVSRDWPLSHYQTVFARDPGSAEMPSASRPFSPSVVTRLVSAGVLIAPLTLHCGVSSLEGDEDPYPEPYDVPPATAELVNHVRARGNRVIAGGTTVVRALETVAAPDGHVTAGAGWTSHVVTPETGVRAVDGLLTGLHEPRSSHLRMLAAFAGPSLLNRCYQAAVDAGISNRIYVDTVIEMVKAYRAAFGDSLPVYLQAGGLPDGAVNHSFIV